MIALIAELYGIESRMRKCDKLGSDEHQQLRQTETAAVMARIDAWLTATAPKCLPKGPLGKAISYAKNQWPHLQLCCSDVTDRQRRDEVEDRACNTHRGASASAFASFDERAAKSSDQWGPARA